MRFAGRQTLAVSFIIIGSVLGTAACSTSGDPAQPSAATPTSATPEVDVDAAIASASGDALDAATAAIEECAAGAYGNCDVWAWTPAHHTIERWDVGAPVLVDAGQVVEYEDRVIDDPIATVCQTYEATGTGSAVAVDASPASEGDVRIAAGVIVAVAADGAVDVAATYRCGP